MNSATFGQCTDMYVIPQTGCDLIVCMCSKKNYNYFLLLTRDGGGGSGSSRTSTAMEGFAIVQVHFVSVSLLWRTV